MSGESKILIGLLCDLNMILTKNVFKLGCEMQHDSQIPTSQKKKEISLCKNILFKNFPICYLIYSIKMCIESILSSGLILLLTLDQSITRWFLALGRVLWHSGQHFWYQNVSPYSGESFQNKFRCRRPSQARFFNSRKQKSAYFCPQPRIEKPEKIRYF